MKLKLAGADFTFPLLPHEHVLDLLAMLGLQGVDVGLFAGRSHIQPAEAFRNVPASARELAHKLNARGLALADAFLQTGATFDVLAVNHPDANERAKARDIFLRCVEFTARCNGLHMTMLPGVAWPQEPLETSLKRSAAELAWRVEQAYQLGITFSVEAHVGSIVPSPAEAKQLIDMTPGLTLTLDYTHFTRLGMSDAEIEPLMAHASHFHARGARKDRLQAPLKDNMIDYARVLRAMERTGYAGWVGLEYVWIDWEHCNEVDNVAETILLRDFLLRNMN